MVAFVPVIIVSAAPTPFRPPMSTPSISRSSTASDNLVTTMASHNAIPLNRIVGMAFIRIAFENPDDASKATIWVRFLSKDTILTNRERVDVDTVRRMMGMNEHEALYFHMRTAGLARIDGVGQTQLAVDHQLRTETE